MSISNLAPSEPVIVKSPQRKAALWILLITQTISLLGSRMSAFAVGIWVTQQTGNATPLALVAFFTVVPMILLSNIAGAVADRFDRRRVMALANIGQSVGSLFLIASFVSGHFQLWHLYSVAFLQSAFGIFLMPALQASITMLVPDAQRDRANAINQITAPLAGTLAPGIAGMLYVLIGVAGVLVLDLISFWIAAVAALVIFIPRPVRSSDGEKTGGSMWRELASGVRYLWSRRLLFWLMIYAAFLNFGFYGCEVLGTPYILARTGSPTQLGAILSVMNLGAIGGGILMGIWGGTRPRIHTMLPGLILAGISLTLYGFSQNPVLLGLALLGTIFPMPFVNAAFMSMLQTKVPPDLQGRVFAVITQLTLLLSPLAFVILGPLADNVFEPAVGKPGWEAFAPLFGSSHGAGLGLLIAINGAIITLISLAVYAIPSVRRVEAILPDYAAQAESAPVPEMVAGR